MSVRKEKRRNPGTGEVHEKYTVDVLFHHADGRSERIRKDSPVQTLRGAEQFERQLRQELLNGTYGKSEAVPVPLFAAFEKEFISNYSEVYNKGSEVETKRSVLKNHLVPAFGHLRLDQIDERAVEVFKARKLKEGLGKKTVNNYQSILRKMLSVAVKWKVLTTVPEFTWLKTADAPFDFLSFEEAKRVLTTAEQTWRCMIMTACRTGLRIGELLALRWASVDLKGAKIKVWENISRGKLTSPKNYRMREIDLGHELLAELKHHRHLRGEYVFCREDGTRLTRGECKHPLWRACEAAQLGRRIGWHVLRHTFASHLVMKGAPLKVVQELLGHSTIKMTERYAHLSHDSRRDAVHLLDGHVNTASMGDVVAAN